MKNKPIKHIRNNTKSCTLFLYLFCQILFCSIAFSEESHVLVTTNCTLLINKDSHVISHSADTNYASESAYLKVYRSKSNEQTKVARAFVGVDLSSNCTETGLPLPADSNITAAYLRLFPSDKPTNEQQVNLQRVEGESSNWDEATITWNNQPDVLGIVQASSVVVANGKTATVKEWDVLSDIQAFEDGTFNNGWRLSINDESYAGSGLDVAYIPHENSKIYYHPRLLISYQTSVPSSSISTTPVVLNNPTLDFYVKKCDAGYKVYQMPYGRNKLIVDAALESEISMIDIANSLLYLDHTDSIYQQFIGWDFIIDVPAREPQIRICSEMSGAGTNFQDLVLGGEYIVGGINADGQDTLMSTITTLNHEKTHQWDGRRGHIFLPDHAGGHHFLYGVLPLQNELTLGGSIFGKTNSFLPSGVESFATYNAAMNRYLSNPQLTWESYYSDAAVADFLAGTSSITKDADRENIYSAIFDWIRHVHGATGLKAVMAAVEVYRIEQDIDLKTAGDLGLTNEQRNDNFLRALSDGLLVDGRDYYTFWKFPISAVMNTYLDDKAYPEGIGMQDFDNDGVTPLEGDFDDDDSTVYPRAPELADGIDNNLDGIIDGEIIFDDAGTDLSEIASDNSITLPATLYGKIETLADIDAVQFTLAEDALITVLIRGVDSDDTVIDVSTEKLIENFVGGFEINGSNKTLFSPKSRSATLSKIYPAGTYDLSVEALVNGNYPANTGTYVVQVLINDQQPNVMSNIDGIADFKFQIYNRLSPGDNFDCTNVDGVSTQECQSLLDIFEELNGSDWLDARGWMEAESPCYWKGIKCNATGVKRLILNSDRLVKGNIRSVNWHGFTAVEYLNISSPNLYGALPSHFSTLPISKLTFSNSANLCLFSDQRAWFDALEDKTNDLPNCVDNDGDGIEDDFGSDVCPATVNYDSDFDLDGCDDATEDDDDDGDGVADVDDVFPLDATESIDTDGDGIGNNVDTDDDNDGIADLDDALPLDDAESVDTDGDGVGNNADTDDDNDGLLDEEDEFPLDELNGQILIEDAIAGLNDNPLETCVTELNLTFVHELTTLTCNGVAILTGIDAFTNLTELSLISGAFTNVNELLPLVSLESVNLSHGLVTEYSGLINASNLKSFINYGYLHTDLNAISGLSSVESMQIYSDVLNSLEGIQSLTNLTGFYSIADNMTGINQLEQLPNLNSMYLYFPLVSDFSPVLKIADQINYLSITDSISIMCWQKSYMDNVNIEVYSTASDCNDISANQDYDADGISNIDEVNVHGTNPVIDDTDEDGVLDGFDVFPFDDSESVDTDNDGTGNNADTDDDNDGVLDDVDAFPLDDSESVDTDGDGFGNNADTDDDNDGVLDGADALPLDATETIDTDNDGTGNNADTDDDNDGILDENDDAPLDDNTYDLTAPVIIVSNNIVVAATSLNGTDSTESNIVIFLAAANANDNFDGVITVNNDAPDIFPIGETTVTFSATDAAGNTGTEIATVIVADQTKPVIVLTGNNSMTLILNDTFSEPGFSAIDNVDGDLVNNVVVTGSVNTAVIGNYILFYNVTDAAGNEAISMTRQVTVQDVSAPVIIAPNNIVVAAVDADGTAENETSIAAFLSSANGSDDVDANVVVTNDAPSIFPIGVTLVTFSATDAAANTGTETATITVADQAKPVLSLIGSTSMTLVLNQVFTDPGATASDNVDGDISANVIVVGSVDISAVGTYTLTYNVSDDAGNTANTMTRQVTIQDANAPVIIAPNNIIVAAIDANGTPATDNAINTFLSLANGSDDVDVNVVVTNDALTIFPIGVTMVTFSATDAAGNIGTATATITVADKTKPALSLTGNTSMTRVLHEVFTDPGATASDNVDGDLSANVIVVGSVDTSAVGIYTLTYNVSDAAGNSAVTMTRQVTVQDASAPVIIAPNNIIVEAVGANGTPAADNAITTFLSSANGSDDVDVNVVVTNDAPSIFTIGVTLVTFSATDAAGNIGTATATVTVADQTKPVITLSGNTSITLVLNETYIEPGFTALDNVDGDLTNGVVVTGSVNTAFIGNYTLTYKVSDAASNFAVTMTRQVTVQDASAPVIIAPNNIVVAAADSNGISAADTSIMTFLSSANGSDDVDVNVVVNNDAPGIFPLGTNIVTFLATDAAGNLGSATSIVSVTDQSIPVITLNGEVAITINLNEIYTDAGASVLDNVDGDISANVVMKGAVDMATAGIYTLSYNVNDAAGNAAIKQTRLVTVQDPDLVDSDNDGVPDVIDALPNDPDETIDTDADGIGNNADLDDDNDGVADIDDPFSLDSSESVDTDGDGIGNNTDSDDDNDGIVDEDDSSPLDATTGDNQAPSIGDIESLVIEATAEFTPVSLVPPSVADNNINAPSITADLLEALALGEHIVTWTATDYAGNQASKMQSVSIVDTTAPVFDQLAVITLNAQGHLTDISDEIDVTAFDLVDGELSVQLTALSELTSGHHDVELSVTDLSGNSVSALLAVNILPETNVISQRNVEKGGLYHLAVNLSGDAPSYPVEVLYSLYLNNRVYDEASTSIASGTQGWVPINIAYDLSTDDVLSLNLVTATNAFIGDAKQAKLVLINRNVAPLLDVELTQNGERVSVIDPDNGLLRIAASISDVNQLDVHDINWLVHDNTFIDEALDSNELTFEVDPSVLTEGIYSLDITATETNTEEGRFVTKTLQFVIEQLTLLDTETDSDSDGIVDSEEGDRDSDGDGIVDYLDDDSNITRLPSSENTEPMQTSPGLAMSLGSLVASRGASNTNASLTIEDLAQLVGDDAADTQDDHFQRVTPLYNFIISGLADQGNSVAVVIPLESGTSLPTGAKYRKYNTVNGWFSFIEDDNNSVSSAPVDESGNCPAANDISYIQGLTVGDNCIQLIIEDGGPNDTDFGINGTVEDPGAVVIEKKNEAPVIDLNANIDVNEETPITLDASGTRDTERDDLTYSWLQNSGKSVDLINTTTSQLSFTSPTVAENEILTFKLTVDDGIDSSIQIIQVTVYQVNKAPVVSIETYEPSPEEGATIIFISQGSDPDDDALNYQWKQLSGAPITFDDAAASQVTINLPEVDSDEVIEIQVTVSDGELSSSTSISFTLKNKVKTIVPPEKKRSGGATGWLLILFVVKRLKKVITIAKAA